MPDAITAFWYGADLVFRDRQTGDPDTAKTHMFTGFTRCCERPVYVPLGTRDADVPLTGCCDRPFAAYGPKPITLPPYSGEHVSCPKCGVKAVETRLQPQVAAVGMRGPIYNRPLGYPEEWLARRCAVCQATWDEACVDSSAAITPEDLRIEAFTNGAMSSVRIIHLPTGIVSTGTGRDEAMQELRRLLAARTEPKASEI